MNSPMRTAQETQALVERSLSRRYWAERRFRFYGLAAVTAGMAFLVYLFVVIFSNGLGAFRQTEVRLDIFYDPAVIDPNGTRNIDDLHAADYQALVRAALKQRFPEVEGRAASRELTRLVSSSAAFDLQRRVIQNPALIGTTETQWLLASDGVDLLQKGHIDAALPEEQRPLNDRQIGWLKKLDADGALALKFNKTFLTGGDSREPERAGIWGAVAGSFFTLVLTLLLSFPIGVAAAIYLEEFARRSRWTDLIEVNINNLAAVPSIVFGLLGLAVFINFFGLPRSAPLVGGLVLTLMTLPTIIIASRAARSARCCTRVTNGQVASITFAARRSRSCCTCGVTPWARITAIVSPSASSGVSMVETPWAPSRSISCALWISGPSERMGRAPSWTASSTISTARSTPKQNPYSSASKTSISRFAYSKVSISGLFQMPWLVGSVAVPRSRSHFSRHSSRNLSPPATRSPIQPISQSTALRI